MSSLQSGKVWLVTGASAGLGLAVVLSALKAGHKVIACARNPQKAAQNHPEVLELGGTWLKLDVSTSETKQIVEGIVTDVGRIDVVVNNAGILGIFGAMEDISELEFQNVMNTNFYGPMRVVRGVLPAMRAQRSGTIIQISSTCGIVSSPANSPYCTSKFALEGFSESLAQEVKPFNIRVILIVAGMFHTDIMGKVPWASTSKDYQDPAVSETMGWVEHVKAGLDFLTGGDPNKFGDRVVNIADGKGLGVGLGEYLRVPLGRDALETCKQKAQKMAEESAALECIALSTGYENADA